MQGIWDITCRLTGSFAIFTCVLFSIRIHKLCSIETLDTIHLMRILNLAGLKSVYLHATLSSHSILWYTVYRIYNWLKNIQETWLRASNFTRVFCIIQVWHMFHITSHKQLFISLLECTRNKLYLSCAVCVKLFQVKDSPLMNHGA